MENTKNSSVENDTIQNKSTEDDAEQSEEKYEGERSSEKEKTVYTNAQEWLDKNYPKEERSEIT